METALEKWAGGEERRPGCGSSGGKCVGLTLRVVGSHEESKPKNTMIRLEF